MSVRKHLAGLGLFTIILGSAILINNLVTYPIQAIPRTVFTLPFPVRVAAPQNLDHKVRLVSLDFINKQSYTSLVLQRQRGLPLPENIRVTNYFFSPAYPGRVWMTVTEIPQPFSAGDRVEYVAIAPCAFCSAVDAPRNGYFARVEVSTTASDQTYPSDVSTDITTAERVVVQAERKPASSITR